MEPFSPMSFIRTVLGDIPAKDAGICYAHEHVVLQGSFIEQNFPDFILADLDKICEELHDLRWFGVQTMIDAMPLDSGRSAAGLAEVSRRTKMNIVGATGLHLRMYYSPGHWYDTISEDDLTARFIEEISSGMTDAGVRLPSKAGVIKVASGRDQLTLLEVRNFRAAARAQAATGCAILTHTEQGTAALEQVRVLQDAGADLSHVVLSHLDRIPDAGYHREVLGTGVRLEFDSGFRWKGGPNVTLGLVLQLAPDFPESIVLGMDAARFAYWKSFGGKPGLAFLMREFAPHLLDADLAPALLHKILVENPAAAYLFT